MTCTVKSFTVYSTPDHEVRLACGDQDILLQRCAGPVDQSLTDDVAELLLAVVRRAATSAAIKCRYPSAPRNPG